MRTYTILVLSFLLHFSLQAQENIPLGTWRAHVSFHDLDQIVDSEEKIYAANEVGLLELDVASGELTTISKLDGLNSAPVSALGYSQTSQSLIVGHQNGLITILSENVLEEVDVLAVASSITGSRNVHHISTQESRAYLSTDFGLVVFNLSNRQVIETYRDLGATGGQLTIFGSVVFQDTLWLATAKGVLGGSLNGSTNLLDFRNWKRYDTGDLDAQIRSLAVLNNKLHTVINNKGIFRLEGDEWVATGLLQSKDFTALRAGTNKLLICTTDELWTYDGVSVSQLGVSIVSKPEGVLESNGIVWVADGKNGLVSISGNDIKSFKPNAPSGNSYWRLTSRESRIIGMKGGFANGIPLERIGVVDQFVNGQWNSGSTTLATDVVDFAQIGTTLYYASFGTGLEKIDDNTSVIYDPSNSPLNYDNSTSQKVLVSTIESREGSLWVVNYGASASLLELQSDQTWKQHSNSLPQTAFATELLFDRSGNAWMIIDPFRGGGIVVYNPTTSQSKFLTKSSGQGTLPSLTIKSMALDRDGAMWIGTDEGVVYFSNPGTVLSSNVDATRPIFENRFLLRDETITAIAIDGGNRKWLGTTNGVWLFDPLGEELIYNFTEENSPLLSNEIISISIDENSGEVFFATANGLVSFRADATKGRDAFEAVKIFPNPVDPGFNGIVAIEGLLTDAVVKITDMGGNLVWQTRANGGTAAWNARHLNGNRVSSGVYLVFATSEDGSEKHVGKIAVIE